MSVEFLTRRILHTQGNIHFVLQEARLPNQRVVQKGIIDHPGAVCIVPLTPDNEVILIRQYRLAADKYLLEIPAGTLEPGEDPRACAERELQEEAGYFPGTLSSLGGFYMLPGMSNEFLHLFLARDLRPSRLTQDEDEIIDVVQLPLAEALKRITTHEIQDGKTIIGLMRTAGLG